MLLYRLTPNIKYGSRKPEVHITFLYLQIPTSFKCRNGITCTGPRPTSGDTIVCRISNMADNNRKWGGT